MNPTRYELAFSTRIRHSAGVALAASFILLAGAAASVCLAQGGAGAHAPRQPWVSPQDRQQPRVRAQAMRQRADQLRRQAQSRYVKSRDTCSGKSLVSSCLDDAKKARIKSMQGARRLDSQASNIERDLRRRQGVNDPVRRAQGQAEIGPRPVSGPAERESARRPPTMQHASPARARGQQQGRQMSAEKAQQRAARVAEAHKRAEAARRQRAEIERRIAEHEKKRAERNAAARSRDSAK